MSSEFTSSQHPEQFIIIKSTFHSLTEAQGLARQLLKKNLISAGQINALYSLYWWEERKLEEEEWELSCLTRADLYQQVADFITTEHSFVMPEIIAVPVLEIGQQYGQWIEEYTVDPDNHDRE